MLEVCPHYAVCFGAQTTWLDPLLILPYWPTIRMCEAPVQMRQGRPFHVGFPYCAAICISIKCNDAHSAPEFSTCHLTLTHVIFVVLLYRGW